MLKLTAVAFNDANDALGEAIKRDPDRKPFSNPILQALGRVAVLLDVSHSRSFMFAIKAGILTAVTSLPAFIGCVFWSSGLTGVYVVANEQLIGRFLLLSARRMGRHHEPAQLVRVRAQLTSSAGSLFWRYDLCPSQAASSDFFRRAIGDGGMVHWLGRR